MDRLIDFFVRNPVLLVVAVVWLAGLVGTVATAAKRSREAAARRPQTTTMPSPQPMRTEPVRMEPPAARPPAVEARPMGQRDAEAVAREMRKILGLEPEGRAEAGGEGRSEPVAGDRVERQEPAPLAPPPTPHERAQPHAPVPGVLLVSPHIPTAAR